MKRFSPYVKYSMNGAIRYSSIGPDGQKEDSTDLIGEQITKIKSMFPPRFHLREHQEEIMRLILSGKDTFAVLPTGSGKSLCFQAPSVFFSGITLVITPLVALIENQVNNFNGGHYPRYHSLRGNPGLDNYYESLWFKAIYPGMDGLTAQAMFAEIQSPRQKSNEGREIRYKLLYVSPERLRDQKFLRALREAEAGGLLISHVVIDEAHCMSQWGFDFRESYLYIAGFIRERPVRPIISAFTATATPKDQAEIKNLLGFPMKEKDSAEKRYAERIFVKPRNNLRLTVERCSDYRTAADAEGVPAHALKTRKERLLEILAEHPTKVCIIYRTTVAGVNQLYDILREEEQLRERLVKYHAQMSRKERWDSKNDFLKSYDEETNPIRKARSPGKPCKNILIATKAFGMGIDKDDISLVIHYDMPRSLEDYYQEIGRAGRDKRKVPAAWCCLLYSPGPQKEKGTLQSTIQWILSEKETSASGCQPLSSRFSEGMRKYTYFWSYYRLCYMKRYCEYALQYPDAAQNFIIRYLGNKFTLKQTVREWNSFCRYIARWYPVSGGESGHNLFASAEAYQFLGFYFGDSKQEQKQNPYHKELRRLMQEVNELHINNTYVANQLRDHPDKYRLNEPCLPEEDPDCGLAKGELAFTIHGSEKLTYFDMCVLDAIYSIEISGEKTVYVQTVWEILTGYNPRYSSQEKATIRREIQTSIDRMRCLSLSVSDRQCGFKAEKQCFLPLGDKPAGQKGYSCSALPPLFRYAEEKNGQIIKAPVSLFNVDRIEPSALWKEDFEADCGGGERGRETLDGSARHAFDNYVKYLPRDAAYEPRLKELLGDRAYGKLEGVRKRTYSFSPSLDNVLLCHYLIRRISISKKRKRGNFILFSTIREITGIGDPAGLLRRKAAAILNHYQGIGYLEKHYLYITGCTYRLTDGRIITDLAYFQAQATETIKYVKLHGVNHLHLSDFLINWVPEGGKKLPEALGGGGSLCAETKRELARMPLERMEGMVIPTLSC